MDYVIPTVPELPLQQRKKIKRDATNVKRYARFAIIIDIDGGILEVIENPAKHGFTQPIIAILAPSVVGNQIISETVVFEMTYGRAVPYRRIEENISGGNVRIPLMARRRVRVITSMELRNAWESLEKALLSVLKERLSKWKGRGEKFWLGHGHGYYRGVFFRFIAEDQDVLRQLWREHLVYRKPRLQNIFRMISRLRYSYYSEKQLRSFESVRQFVEHCRNLRTIEQHWILEHAGNMQPLVGLIYETFELDNFNEKSPNDPTRLVFDDKSNPDDFPRFESISVYFRRNRTQTTHAKGCLSVEILPTRQTALKLDLEYGEMKRPCSSDGEDIPFTAEEIARHLKRNPVPEDGSCPF